MEPDNDPEEVSLSFISEKWENYKTEFHSKFESFFCEGAPSFQDTCLNIVSEQESLQVRLKEILKTGSNFSKSSKNLQNSENLNTSTGESTENPGSDLGIPSGNPSTSKNQPKITEENKEAASNFFGSIKGMFGGGGSKTEQDKKPIIKGDLGNEGGFRYCPIKKAYVFDGEDAESEDDAPKAPPKKSEIEKLKKDKEEKKRKEEEEGGPKNDSGISALMKPRQRNVRGNRNRGKAAGSGARSRPTARKMPQNFMQNSGQDFEENKSFLEKRGDLIQELTSNLTSVVQSLEINQEKTSSLPNTSQTLAQIDQLVQNSTLEVDNYISSLIKQVTALIQPSNSSPSQNVAGLSSPSSQQVTGTLNIGSSMGNQSRRGQIQFNTSSQTTNTTTTTNNISLDESTVQKTEKQLRKEIATLENKVEELLSLQDQKNVEVEVYKNQIEVLKKVSNDLAGVIQFNISETEKIEEMSELISLFNQRHFDTTSQLEAEQLKRNQLEELILKISQKLEGVVLQNNQLKGAIVDQKKRFSGQYSLLQNNSSQQSLKYSKIVNNLIKKIKNMQKLALTLKNRESTLIENIENHKNETNENFKTQIKSLIDQIRSGCKPSNQQSDQEKELFLEFENILEERENLWMEAIQAYQQELKEDEGLLEGWKEDMEEMSTMVDESVEMNGRLIQNVDSSKKKIQILIKNCKILEEEKQTLKNSILEYQKGYKKQKTSILEASSSIKFLTSVINEYKTRFKIQQNNYDLCLKIKDSTLSQIEQLTVQYDILVNDVRELNENLDLSYKENGLLEKEAEGYKSQIEDLILEKNSKISEFEAKILELEHQKNAGSHSLSTQIEEIQLKLSDSTDENSRLTQELETLRIYYDSQLAELVEKKESLEAEASRLQEQLNQGQEQQGLELKQTSIQEIADLRSLLEDSRAQTDLANQKVADLKSLNDTLVQKDQESSEQTDKDTEEVASLKQINYQLTVQLSNAKRLSQKLESEQEETQGQVGTLQEQVKSQSQIVEDYENEVKQLKEDFNAVNNAKKMIETEVESLTSKLQILESSQDSEGRSDKKEAENGEEEKEKEGVDPAEEKDSSSAVASTSLKNLQLEICDLRKEINQKDLTIEQLNNSLADLQEKLEGSLQSIEESNTKLEEAKEWEEKAKEAEELQVLYQEQKKRLELLQMDLADANHEISSSQRMIKTLKGEPVPPNPQQALLAKQSPQKPPKKQPTGFLSGVAGLFMTEADWDNS